MFVAIQFPFSDVRPFLTSETRRLISPKWPIPEPDKDFIRSTGQVRSRRKGGLEGWAGEEVYCRAARALRFQPSLNMQRLGASGASMMPYCTFRRFLSDGRAVSRVEVGFTHGGGKGLFLSLDGQECLTLINSCLSMAVRVPSGLGGLTSCKLIEADNYLASHFLRSTTQRKHGKEWPVEAWWFTPAQPLLLIEYRPNEIIALPRHSRFIESSKLNSRMIGLSYCRVEHGVTGKGRRLGVWFIEIAPDSDRDIIRRLRLQLFRLHAERQCLKQILRLIATEKLKVIQHTAVSDSLQKYLLDSIRTLRKEKRYGLPQSSILEAAEQFEDIVTEGERATLLSQLEHMHIRKNILNSVDQYTTARKDDASGTVYILADNSTIFYGGEQKLGGYSMTNYEIKFGDSTMITGDFGVANTIQNSFNKVSGANMPEELKQRLKELAEAVGKLSAQLPQDKAREVARDLETLTNEATSSSPRRKWYELSANGLIEAAKRS